MFWRWACRSSTRLLLARPIPLLKNAFSSSPKEWVGELEATEQVPSPKPSSDVDGRCFLDFLRQSDKKPVALLDGRGIPRRKSRQLGVDTGN